MVLGLGSVVLIWLTLHATQVMAAETTRIGEAQVRAYLTIDEATVEPEIIEGRDEIVWYVSAQVRNSGQSPARRVAMMTYSQDFLESAPSQTGDIAAGQPERIGGIIKSKVNALTFASPTHVVFTLQISLLYFDVFHPEDKPRLDTWMFAGLAELVHETKTKLYPMGTIPTEAKPRGKG